jgi:hypothetical protein
MTPIPSLFIGAGRRPFVAELSNGLGAIGFTSSEFFDELRTNGKRFGMIEKIPFMLRVSKHELSFFSNLPVENLRHFFQQPAEAFHALSHVQPFFNRPHPRRHRVNDRYLKILFQQMNDVQAAPTRAEHIDSVRAWML